jgi:putative phosphoribosyl transferase
MDRIFTNRTEAGRELGAAVLERLGRQPAIVLGLPRGGVPVAMGVARALGAESDVLVVRKVGVPTQPELAMGAVGPGGVTVRNEDVLAMLPGAERRFEAVAADERAEVAHAVEELEAATPFKSELGLAGGESAQGNAAAIKHAGID